MNQHWAVVLAAGDGTRLASLTSDDRGRSVPKQFCSLNGGGSLLHAALQRARRIVPPERVCAVVARHHESFWEPALEATPETQFIVQPCNRGTANGVLLATLRIAAADPFARILFLPADHHVRDEAALAPTLHSALALLETRAQELLLVGFPPQASDPELGYIVVGERRGDGTSAVATFVEKPASAIIRDLIARAALWNSFIFAGRATTLLALLDRAFPGIVAGMQAALVPREPRGLCNPALDAFYATLPVVDFSRQILQGAESRLAVLAAAACGWTDLGTPSRVLHALTGLGTLKVTADTELAVPAILDLAAQQARWSSRGLPGPSRSV
jgi:mannose-1-phosphate guanylyltransferase